MQELSDHVTTIECKEALKNKQLIFFSSRQVDAAVAVKVELGP